MKKKTTQSHLYTNTFVEWHFIINQGMYETEIHLPIYVDIFYTQFISVKSDTKILRIAINIRVWGTLEYIYCPGIARAFSDGFIFASSL